MVSPCEGTGYEIGSMSIIKGARNLEMAKKFYDFALRADIQSLAKDAKAYQVPSNKGATPPPEAPDFASIKLIDYDFAKYGSADERTPAAEEVGGRGQLAAALMWQRDRRAGRRLGDPRRPILLWLAVGWVGFALLPWYGLDDGILASDWLLGRLGVGTISTRPACSRGCGTASRGCCRMPCSWRCRCWRSPGGAGRGAATILIAAGRRRPRLVAAAGLRDRPARHPVRTGSQALLGQVKIRQFGMGWGALLTATAFLFFLTQGLAARGAGQGRRASSPAASGWSSRWSPPSSSIRR